MITELVKFKNSTGLFLDGLYFYRPDNNCVVVHVHGSFGNFYSNPFIKSMAQVYNAHRISFLSFNLTQHDGIAEAVREIHGLNRWEYVGYSLSDYDSCIDDIEGACNYVRNRENDIIILQGHSLGCNRVLYYINKTKMRYPTILLSPTNSYELQRRWIMPETIDHQISRLSSYVDQNNISFTEHGVKTPDMKIDNIQDTVPFIPISPKALVSLLKNPSMDIINMIDHNHSVLNEAFIYMGDVDEYQTDSLESYYESFNRYFSKVVFKVIKGGNHSFSDHEKELVESIADWINSIDYTSLIEFNT